MSKSKETYTEQVERECKESEMLAYGLIALPFALIGYGVGSQLIMAFTDDMWGIVLTPIVFSVIFAFVAVFMFYTFTKAKYKKNND